MLADKLRISANHNIIDDEFTSFQAGSLGHAVGHSFKETRFADPDPLVFQLPDHFLIFTF